MASSRKLQYADRVALQQADQAIRKDVLRALVEVITNCNDSYSRLEHAGQPVSGQIIIEIKRKHTNSVIRVRDNAEGMNDARMDKVVGTYGEATSGIKEDKHVRGMWGRGLKDAIFGLGYGYVRSIQDDNFYSSSLLLNKGVPTFELEDPTPATPELREKHGTPTGNGTEIEVIVSRDDVKMPQYDNIRNYLQRHFELRPIMSNPTRRIVLRDIVGRDKIRHEHVLSYKPPRGEKILDEQVAIEDFPVTARLEVFRSNIQLSTRGEEGDYADAGLLVVSRSMVISLTMLKFENDPYASFFYGSVQCDYLHELLKNDEPVLTATRDGINWTHPFAKALKTAIENRLDPLVQAEREHAIHDEQTKLDKRLRQKLNHALHELNTIAVSELSDRRDDEDDKARKKIDLASSGIVFTPERVFVQTGQLVSLNLHAQLPDKDHTGLTAHIISDTPEIIVLTPHVVMEPRADNPTVGFARVKVEGRQVGSEGVITAFFEGHRAMALVQVRSKKESITAPPSKERGGLFTDIHFDDRTDPRQRVYFDRVNSSIVIATAAPSVRIYLDKQNRLDTTREGQVLLAELITEAVCREIARRGVERGRFLAPEGAEADAIQTHFIRLQNRYAHLIHEAIVTLE
ncbi:MAG: ATP-binding protein [Chloroflexi bacterium]|nr:ATP-binding protein [Chloroflexota bacterium]